MIKAVVFDIGGVVASENNLKEHYIPLCKILNLNKEKFFKIREKHMHNASSGKISGKKLISIFARELGVDYKTMLNFWINIKKKSTKRNHELIKMIIKLKKKGYKIGCLSGVIDIHYDVYKKKKIYNEFSFKILSYKIGINKPELKIYKLLINKLKLKPSEIVVIDDYEVCLKSARKAGLKTILYKNNKKLTRDLKKLGVKF